MNIDQALALLKKGGSPKPLFKAFDISNASVLGHLTSDIYQAGAVCGACGACGVCGVCGACGACSACRSRRR